MKKIPTLFKRDFTNGGMIIPEYSDGTEWVLAGEGVATRKYDGSGIDQHGNKSCPIHLDEVRDKIERLEHYGCPDSYLQNELEWWLEIIKLQQEALLDRVEKEVIKSGPTFTQAHDGPDSYVKTQVVSSIRKERDEQRQAINKLRLEL